MFKNFSPIRLSNSNSHLKPLELSNIYCCVEMCRYVEKKKSSSQLNFSSLARYVTESANLDCISYK
jgi:hypothetical protein